MQRDTWQLLATSQQAIKMLTGWKIPLISQVCSTTRIIQMPRTEISFKWHGTYLELSLLNQHIKAIEKGLSAAKTRHRLLKTDVTQLTHMICLIRTYSF